MLLKQIEYFVVLAEEKSFTETGYKFNISQSAVSQQIYALEKELGIGLIKRDSKKFELTNAGEYFYQKGKNILSSIDNLKDQTIEIGKYNDLILNIGYLNSYNGNQLTQALKEFTKTYPEVEINIFSGTHEEIYNLLKKGEVLLALNDQRRAFSDEYENQKVYDAFYTALLPKESNLPNEETIEIDKLSKLPCIIIANFAEQQTERKYFNDLLGNNFQYIFSNDIKQAQILVSAGKGFLLTDNLFTETDSEHKLLPITKAGQKIKKPYCVFWRKSKANYYIEELAKLLVSKFQ